MGTQIKRTNSLVWMYAGLRDDESESESEFEKDPWALGSLHGSSAFDENNCTRETSIAKGFQTCNSKFKWISNFLSNLVNLVTRVRIM